MKARTLMIRSFAPWWSSAEKCVPTASFSCCLKRIGSSLRPVWHFFILLKWPWNLAMIVLLVWPTYCLPHVLQLMQ